ncbi:MAG: hypothetical protein HC889_17415, partial [Synechococcaceae cyanobacterium SM1_2_3]|nr:hypothetical protein [Synechococcaceae cyanobacterium SM1_2_3]
MIQSTRQLLPGGAQTKTGQHQPAQQQHRQCGQATGFALSWIEQRGADRPDKGSALAPEIEALHPVAGVGLKQPR